jgi:hypothetical protein
VNVPAPRSNALATLGVGFSLALWVFAYFAFVYAFGDVMHNDREELRGIVTQRAYLAMVFTILTIISFFVATWLSGYTLTVAKIRACLAGISCAAFLGLLLWIYIADNLRAAGAH